jgi:hypothetical protein
MKSALLLLILILPICQKATGQTAHFSRGCLVILDAKQRFKLPGIGYDVNEDDPPSPPIVHAIKKLHGEYFVVISTSSWSLGGRMSHGAGASGIESNIEWLHVVDGKIQDRKAFLYESWRHNRQGSGFQWKGPILSVETDAEIPEKVAAKAEDSWETITFSFDTLHPENGIMEVHSKPYSPYAPYEQTHPTRRST